MKNNSPDKIVKEMLSGDVRSLSKVITEIESETKIGDQYLDLLFPHTGKAKIIGVTGSPGAGKSTLVDGLAAEFVKNKNRVAILAIDPSSPFSGGAVLGDRVRMLRSSSSSSVFIRSMASRGSLGGLAPKTMEVVFALDAFGYDYIIIETVGVGQAEVEIVRIADTVLVVLVPGMGDAVQAMKAGILEIADIFLINKSDYSGADAVEKDLRTLLSLSKNEAWEAKIIKTIATKNDGIQDTYAAILEHQAWISSNKQAQNKKFLMFEDLFRKELARVLSIKKENELKSRGLWEGYIEQISKRKRSPRQLSSILS